MRYGNLDDDAMEVMAERDRKEGKTMRLMHGSLVNVLMDNATQPDPQVGDGATVLAYSDRHPATITEIRKTPSGKRVVTVQEDNAERLDSNGMSECQEYRFSRNAEGRTYTFFEDKHGRFTERGKGCSLRIGERSKYHDFSF
jgi:hypothetical protein